MTGHDAPDAAHLETDGMPEIEIIRTRVALQHLCSPAEGLFGELVKAVVDVGQGSMAIGGELHADEEALLLSAGSLQPTCGASTSILPSAVRAAGSNSTR